MPESPGSHPSLAIAVPAYNEGSAIVDACAEIVAVARRYPGVAAVVAVDDGSGDGSGAVLDELAAAEPLAHCVHHEVNRGYGAACRTGAAWAHEQGFEYVAFIDSDLTNPPDDLLRIGELAAAGAAYVKASRYLAGAGVEGVSLYKRLISRTGNGVGSLLFGLPPSDLTNGFRAARTDLYCSLPLRETGFVVIMEELYWVLAGGHEIATFPTVLRARDADRRPSAFSYTPRVMQEYLRFPLRSFADRRLSRRRRRAGGEAGS